MGKTPLDRIIAWFYRPRTCMICDKPVPRGERCTDYCEAELADMMAI